MDGNLNVCEVCDKATISLCDDCNVCKACCECRRQREFSAKQLAEIEDSEMDYEEAYEH